MEPCGRRASPTRASSAATPTCGSRRSTARRRARATTAPGFDGRPDWSPDGRRLAFVSNRGGAQRIWLMRADGSRQRPLEGSEPGDDTPDWAVVEDAISPERGSLLPDLDQQAPSGDPRPENARAARGSDSPRRSTTSATARSTSEARASAPRGSMRADQLVHRRDGTVSVVAEIGRLAYEAHPPHFHWHLEPYEAYELRRASDDTFVGARRQERVLPARPLGSRAAPPGDRPGAAEVRRRLRRAASRMRVASTRGRRSATPTATPGSSTGRTSTSRGSSPGSTSSSTAPTRERRIRELRYSNNDASALIRISPLNRLTGAPTATIVRRCPASDRCQAG